MVSLIPLITEGGSASVSTPLCRSSFKTSFITSVEVTPSVSPTLLSVIVVKAFLKAKGISLDVAIRLSRPEKAGSSGLPDKLLTCSIPDAICERVAVSRLSNGLVVVTLPIVTLPENISSNSDFRLCVNAPN